MADQRFPNARLLLLDNNVEPPSPWRRASSRGQQLITGPREVQVGAHCMQMT